MTVLNVRLLLAAAIITCGTVEKTEAAAWSWEGRFALDYVLSKVIDRGIDEVTAAPDLSEIQKQINHFQQREGVFNGYIVNALREIHDDLDVLRKQGSISEATIKLIFANEAILLKKRLDDFEQAASNDRQRFAQLEREFRDLDSWLRSQVCQRLSQLKKGQLRLRKRVKVECPHFLYHGL